MDAFEWGDKLPTLTGPRVNLRWLSHEDAPALFKIFGDPEVMRFWSSPPLKDLAGAAKLVDEIHELFKARRLYQWGVYRRDGDTVFGTCTLFNVDPVHRRAEVGFAIARDAWGQGFVTEALRLLIRFSFETLAMHRLEADADPENVRSLRLLERQGFRREGYLRERWHHLGRVHDAVFLGLLAKDWLPSAKAP
jgi:ribosomal-protein-alanine N-acetyltransferase